MTTEEIEDLHHILSVFGLSKRDLAGALGVAPFTVDRWAKGASKPVGVQAEVLTALHAAALTLDVDRKASRAAGKQIKLGIGSIIFHALTDVRGG